MAISAKQNFKKIPLIKPDLPSFQDLEDCFREVFENGKVTNFGKYVTEFEREMSRYLGAMTITVSSGTMALMFTLQALGIKPGQKVIVPSFTFMATAQAICYSGGIPVFAEVGEQLTLSPIDLEQLLELHPDVFAVIPVHLYGLPCEVEKIKNVIERHESKKGSQIHLVYDAAHAFGASRNGVRVGNFGDAEVFSLSVTKALAAVEGGVVASHNTELIERIKSMRNYGIGEKYDTYGPGLNGKLSELHAIVGLNNLKNLDEILLTRKDKAAYFQTQIEEKTAFRLVPMPDNAIHTFKDFTVIVPAPLKEKRNQIMSFLAEQGIETRAYFYPPVHEQRFFKRYSDRPLPLTEDYSRRVITLPFFTSISETEVDYMTEQLIQAEKNCS